MNENKLKHLEFIQNVITRMNSNSFLIKGWSVTLVSAICVVAANDADKSFVFLAYIPIAVFWLLDAFFLSQEKQYRDLYVAVSQKTEDEIDFSMNASGYNKDDRTWCSCILTKTLTPFYCVLIVAVAIVLLMSLHKK